MQPRGSLQKRAARKYCADPLNPQPLPDFDLWIRVDNSRIDTYFSRDASHLENRGGRLICTDKRGQSNCSLGRSSGSVATKNRLKIGVHSIDFRACGGNSSESRLGQSPS
jgi:hypothetical protein